MKRWFISAIVGVVALALPSIAAAQTWSDPVALTSTAANVPREIEGGDRLTVAMWTGDSVNLGPVTTVNAVFATDRMAGDRAWPQPVRLTADGERTERAFLSVGGDDRAVVVWSSARGDGGPGVRGRLVERIGVGAWSAPRDIPGVDGTIIGASFLDSGALIVAWSRPGGAELFVTRLSRDGRWNDPVHTQLPASPNLVADDPLSRVVRFITSPNGHIAIVGLNQEYALVALRGHENGTWADPVNLTHDGVITFVDAAIGTNGAITAVASDGQHRVKATALAPGASGWSSPHEFGRQTFFNKRVVIGANGRATALWVMPSRMAIDGTRVSGSPGHIETSTQQPDGTWGEITELRDGERKADGGQLAVAIAGDGRPAIAWAPYVSFQPANLNASVMRADGSWATEQIAPGYTGIADYMTLGADRRGILTAAWVRPDAGLYIASTDPAVPRTGAPTTTTPTPPTAAKKRLRILSHRARVNARWSKLRPKVLPGTCRLTVAGTCTYRVTVSRAVARRLGLRVPKRGPFVAGTKRIVVRANSTNRVRVTLKSGVRRAVSRALNPRSRKPMRQVTLSVRKTATDGSSKVTRMTTYKLRR